jgi:putative transposase
MGYPTMLQHDHGLEFRGSQRDPRSAGLVTKLCLALGIESGFIPVRQPDRTGTIENVNGVFQRLVLHSQTIAKLDHLCQAVSTFEGVANTPHPHVPLNGQTSCAYEHAMGFVPQALSPAFTCSARFRFSDPPDGTVSFICRVRKSGTITIASEKFEMAPHLAWDYVYATIFVKEQTLKISHQGQIIKEFPYELKT